MLTSTLPLLLLLNFNSAHAGTCQTVEQSWTHEPVYCQNQGYANDRPYRCYAVVEEGGHRFKVWGSDCWATSFDCSFGDGKVDACK